MFSTSYQMENRYCVQCPMSYYRFIGHRSTVQCLISNVQCSQHHIRCSNVRCSHKFSEMFSKCHFYRKQAFSPDQYMGCLFVERYWRCIGWDKNVFVSFSGSSCKRASGNSSSRGISARYLWDTKPSTIIYTARHIVQNILQEIFKREDNSRQRSWQQFICWIAETWEEEKINIFLKVCTTWKIFSRCACFGLVQCASRSVFCNCVQMCAVGR